MGQAVELCRTLEGVQFTVAGDDGPIRAVILGDALQLLFGAGTSPTSWLGIYADHADGIDAAVRASRGRRRSNSIVLLRASADGRLIEANPPGPVF